MLADWGPLLSSWTRTKFRSADYDMAEQEVLLQRLESEAACCRADGDRRQGVLTHTAFMQARDALKLDKATGPDGIPREIFAVLDKGTCHQVYRAFGDRLVGLGRTPILVWRQNIGVGL